MAKRSAGSPDALLARLSALRQVPSSPEFLAELRKAVGHASPAIVARAAELVGKHEKSELAPDLMAAFASFMGGTADRSFAARTAIARALVDLKIHGDAEPVYLRGVRLGGGGPTSLSNDSAAELRAACAYGLMNARHRDAMAICTDLLADAAPLVRVAAARALTASGRESAALLMRLKLRLGDTEPEVLVECVTGMMALSPADSLNVAATCLMDDDAGLRAAAAVAIGGSREPEAVELLRGAFAREQEPDVRRAILAAAVSTRSSEAVGWLIELAAKRDVETAADAIAALGPYRLDEAIRRRVAGIVTARNERSLVAIQKQIFG